MNSTQLASEPLWLPIISFLNHIEVTQKIDETYYECI
jgi:hypothetical protein